MNTFIQKMRILEKKISAEKGNFVFFALTELENRQNEWDVVVSAPWLPSREIEAISVMTDSIFDVLDKDELLQLSRVVILNSDEPFIKEVVKKSGGREALSDVFINGLEIRNIHILSNHKKHEDKIDMLLREFGINYDMLKVLLADLIKHQNSPDRNDDYLIASNKKQESYNSKNNVIDFNERRNERRKTINHKGEYKNAA